MLHFFINRPLRSDAALEVLAKTAVALGASLHRVGSSDVFHWTAPVRNLKRFDRVLGRLQRDLPGERFSIVDVTAFSGAGVEWRAVDLRDELAKLEGGDRE